jgi:hypothetical protein
MRKNFFVFAFLVFSILAISNSTYACPTFEFGLSSVNNGSPFSRTFRVSPSVMVRNPSTGAITYTTSLTTFSYGGQQMVFGYVGSNSYCGLPMFEKNIWYTIKANQLSLPCKETVFKINYQTAYQWTNAPNLQWQSGGSLGSYGKMFVNGDSYPSPYTVGVTYSGTNYQFKWQTVYNCAEPLPDDEIS